MFVIKNDGSRQELDINKIHKAASWACKGLDVSLSDLEASAHIQFVDNITTDSIQNALIKSAAEKICIEEQDWSYVAARLLLQKIYKKANNGSIEYPHIKEYLEDLVEQERVDPRLLEFDLDKINAAIVKDRDLLFNYLGLQIVYDRYLLKTRDGVIRELPQQFWMRVAMGVALAEETPELRNEYAIKFYNELSQFKFMASTPTLFNAGTTFPQLSSCFLLSMNDSLEGIMGTFTEAAQYSKFSGGIGLDMTHVRSSGSKIKSTAGKAGGIIPYAKIYNDVLIGFDQGGKRLGAGALFLEPWHSDIEDFLDLKNNSGDDRRRAHDIFPAVWINDLFMERVRAKADWSLFSPSDVPELHTAYGDEFKEIYEKAEAEGKALKVVKAMDIWKKVLQKLFETGTFWPNFKDRCNLRYMQKDSGAVKSSNLCTEITLRADDNLSAVCNLTSINASKLNPKNLPEMKATVKLAVRFLDNVITVGLIPHEKGRRFNQSDRAVGLGILGYTELLVKAGIDYESQEHVNFASELFEHISYYAIEGSAELAQEKGSYPTFAESEWAKGRVPCDSVEGKHLEKINLDQLYHLDWDRLRGIVSKGMRNSCLLAIAPTATISSIVNATACTELPYELTYNKSNLSGSFTVVAPTLQYNKPELCKIAFDVDQIWTIKSAAARQIWIDQSQSTNIFVYEDVTPGMLNSIYMNAWLHGLKTTYYLRSKAPDLKICKIMDDGCTSCQ